MDNNNGLRGHRFAQFLKRLQQSKSTVVYNKITNSQLNSLALAHPEYGNDYLIS